MTIDEKIKTARRFARSIRVLCKYQSLGRELSNIEIAGVELSELFSEIDEEMRNKITTPGIWHRGE